MDVNYLPKDIDIKVTTDLKKKYTGSTIDIYRNNLDMYAKFLLPKHINKGTFSDVTEFLEALKTKGRASQTRNQYLAALRYYYNTFLKKKFPFDTYKIPRKYVGNEPTALTEDEMLELIAAAHSFRDRMLLCLTYGSGLELSEVTELKPSDINFNNRTIKIRKDKGNFTTVLAESIVDDLQAFIKEEKPEKFLFEGNKRGVKLSGTGVRWVFLGALRRTTIVKPYTVKNLKYSFIKHLQNRGYDLISILKLAGNAKPSTAYKYLQMDKQDAMLRISPLDLIARPKAGAVNTKRLQEKISLLKNEDEKSYLLEAVTCFDNGALRAGIVLAWIAAMRNLQNKMLRHPSLHTLNVAIKKHYKDARDIRNLADFAYINESVQLKAACDLGDIDKSEKTVLENCLDLRNHCGHPGQYNPEELKALAFLEDLLTILFNK